MKKDKPYHQLLNKMLIIEATGEAIYNILSSKVRDKNSKSIYQRLASNESQTAKFIEKELLLMGKKDKMLLRKIILNSSQFIFSLLTVRQLSWFLKKVLKRRIYSHWFDIYKDDNREFWNLLLEHENLQRELLKLP